MDTHGAVMFLAGLLIGGAGCYAICKIVSRPPKRQRPGFGEGYWDTLPPANADLPRDKWHNATREHRWMRKGVDY